jgi:outer membrane protein, heavy metal efflux system
MRSVCRALALGMVLACCTSAVLHAQALPAPLTLEYVQRFAREHRAEIVAARARARAAAQRKAVVSGLEDPMISPSLDHLPFMLHGADVSLAIEQRFPLSGVLGNRGRVADADARRLRAETMRVSLDVELEAAGAFLMLDEQRKMFAILGEQLAVSRQLVSAANARYSAGTGAQSDLLRAEMEVARIEAAARSLVSEVRAAEAMLNMSLGRSPHAAIPALASSAQVTAPAEWDQTRKVALQNRPELAAGRAEIRRAEAEISVMDSMDAPMAMVRVGPAYTMADGAGVMLMVGVSIPIWRDRLDSGVREAEAMAEMARADVVAMSRMVEGEAATSRYLVLAARDRFVALRDDLVPRARRVIEPALSGYAAGTLPLVSVVEAVAAVWSTQEELVSAEAELGFAWARLQRAIGKPARTGRVPR